MKIIILWVSTLALLGVGQILMGGHFGSVMQGIPALMIFGPILFYLIYANGLKGLFGFFNRILNRSVTHDDSSVINTTVSLGFLLSSMSCVLGLVHVMENLSDTSRLGAGIAVAFISVFYGTIPAVLLLPVQNHQNGKSSSTSGMVRKAASFSAATFMTLLLSFFIVLYATSYKG
jgi:flagellar motor component MotA